MTPRRAALALVGVVLLATSTTACGNQDGGRFDASVAEVRAAVDAGDRAGALDALDRLARDGLVAYEHGDIDDGKLQEMASLIDSSRTLVDQVLPGATTTAPATTTTAPPPPAKDPGKKKDEPKGKGHGKD